jgi:hypothetical protein
MSVNRHQRRAAARNRRRHNRFYDDYIRHLPRVPLNAPLERGRVYHAVFFHDPWCRFYDRERIEDCDCNVEVRRFIEPERS